MKTIKQYLVPNFGLVDVVEQIDESDCVFFDLFDSSGDCLNEGNIFWIEPTEFEVCNYVTNNYLTTDVN